MRNRTVLGLVLMLFTVFTGWGANVPQSVEPDKEQMIKEVKALVDKLVQGCETANADEVLGVLANSPEFSYVVNRQYSTYPEFEKGLKGWFEMITGQKLTVENERFSFPFFNKYLPKASFDNVFDIPDKNVCNYDSDKITILSNIAKCDDKFKHHGTKRNRAKLDLLENKKYLYDFQNQRLLNRLHNRYT